MDKLKENPINTTNYSDLNSLKIGIFGLGYVGLPLATSFAKYFPVVGFDKDPTRIKNLKKGYDKNGEFTGSTIKQKNLSFVDDYKKLESCNLYLVTVPTPIDAFNNPDLRFLTEASQTIGQTLKKGDSVIFESTVYPGVTEDICLPILEKRSSLKLNKDFWIGYSPERINPGDKNRDISDIVKVIGASNTDALDFFEAIYSKIIKAGIHRAPSIKVAEAAKVIENIQRDLNIALINELSMLFDELDLNTNEVLEAAKTKWNFLSFQPGLVGGHCIGVDPYYLTHKAKQVGFHPELILAGRRTNDSMPEFVAKKLLRKMINTNKPLDKPILILGTTFKENCRDIRNSKVFSLRKKLMGFGICVDVFDQLADPKAVEAEHQFKLIQSVEKQKYSAIILAVNHDYIKELSLQTIKSYGMPNCIIFDLKSMFSSSEVDISL